MDEEFFSRRVCFEHESGAELYPVRVRRRDTGRVAFRVSNGGNTLEDSMEVDEAEMLRLVLEHGYAVRMSTLSGTKAGLYRPNGRSIIRVQRPA